jgi:hypothetical protein
MDYRRIYDKIIRRAKQRKLPENKYVEVHHIVPKSFFKSLKIANQKNNLVKLLPEEHWICHLLLCKFCEGVEKQKMLQAVAVMSGSKRSKLKCTNKRYAKRKKASSYRKKKKKLLFAVKKNKKSTKKQKFHNQKSFKSGNLKKKSKIIAKAKTTKRTKKREVEK